MAELVPADSKKLEGDDEDARAGDVPEGEDDDGVDDDLGGLSWVSGGGGGRRTT